MTPVRAVTFDCWGTLISDSDSASAMAARVGAIAECAGIDETAARKVLDDAWASHHAAWVRGEQYGAALMASFCGDELGVGGGRVDALREAFEEAGRLGGIFPIDGSVDVLRALKEAGIATALVCDTGLTPGRVVRDFLSEHGHLEFLDFCAFSDEVGAPKPNAKIFTTALDAVGVAPPDGVHVGDLLRTDIAGGRAVGMKTVRITAVNDDAVSGFSWDPKSSFGAKGDVRDGYEDAHEVVSSYSDMPAALRRLGAEL